MRTTKQRLTHYRAQAAKSTHAHAQSWRYWAHNPFLSFTPSTGEQGQRYTETLDQYGTDLGTAHDLKRSIRHTGWFADSIQNDLIIGHVTKLRCPRGTLYIPATMCTGWDGTIHYMRDAILVPKGSPELDHESAIADAAGYADGFAEQEAEQAREDDAKDRANEQIAEHKDTVSRLRKQCSEVIAELRQLNAPLPTAICNTLRASIRARKAEMDAALRKIRALQNDYWIAVN